MKLKELQDRLFELLCLIDDICTKENVPYKLDSGTAIGAVREKDIIPWDDDIDIRVTLSDYPAFIAAMKKHLPEYCRIVEPADFSPNFYDFVTRVEDVRYLIRKETDETRFYNNLENRVGIDVFLQFNVPDNALRRKLVYQRLNLIYGLGMGHRYQIDYGKHSLVERAVIRLVSTFGRLIPAGTICNHFFSVIGKYNSRQSHWVYKTWFVPESFQPAAWHEGHTYGEIRGRKFPLSSGYHEELTAFYGDYMQPPEDRSIYIQHLDEEDRYQDNA